MKHQPKYTDLCQCLINACQATERIQGVILNVTLDGASRITRTLTDRELQLFDFRETGGGTFTVRLRDDQPQPTPQ